MKSGREKAKKPIAKAKEEFEEVKGKAKARVNKLEERFKEKGEDPTNFASVFRNLKKDFKETLNPFVWVWNYIVNICKVTSKRSQGRVETIVKCTVALFFLFVLPILMFASFVSFCVEKGGIWAIPLTVIFIGTFLYFVVRYEE